MSPARPEPPGTDLAVCGIMAGLAIRGIVTGLAVRGIAR
jgi:hypothetical protein